MEDKIQEIMGLVDDVLGCDSAGYQFECKRQIQSKLRELVERCSVPGSLSDADLRAEYLEDTSFEGECAAFRAGARYAERFHNITNTTKE